MPTIPIIPALFATRTESRSDLEELCKALRSRNRNEGMKYVAPIGGAPFIIGGVSFKKLQTPNGWEKIPNKGGNYIVGELNGEKTMLGYWDFGEVGL